MSSSTAVSGTTTATLTAPQNIVSPADIAKRILARSKTAGVAGETDHHKHHGEEETKVTPRPTIRGGVRREVLNTYRGLLKVTQTKDLQDGSSSHATTRGPTSNSANSSSSSCRSTNNSNSAISQKHRVFQLNESQRYIRDQFRAHQKIPRKNFELIQYHVHYGKTKLDELRQGAPFRTGFSTLTFD